MAWAVYDLANTAFSALFVTFFYPLYIKEYLGGTEFQIGMVFGISMLAVGFFVPFLGALSDLSNRRMPFLIFFTVLAAVFTALVAFVGLEFALVFGLFANLCYHSCLAIYNALLPEISTQKNVGSISGIGIALGYLGTLLSLGMAYLVFQILGWETGMGIKAIFPATSIFFLGFAIITFAFIRDRKKPKKIDLSSAVAEVRKTFSALGNYSGLIPFLLSMFFFTNAVTAVIVFLFLYGHQEIGLSIKGFMVLYAFFSTAAALGSLASGKLSDLIGPKRIIIAGGIFWVASTLILIFLKSHSSFLAAGIIGGVGLGTLWTASRPLLLKLTASKKPGEFFGFLESTGKLSGVLGPIIFGFLATYVSYDYALLSLLAFFLLGLVFMGFVRHK